MAGRADWTQRLTTLALRLRKMKADGMSITICGGTAGAAARPLLSGFLHARLLIAASQGGNRSRQTV
jgi:hypothetical protein